MVIPENIYVNDIGKQINKLGIHKILHSSNDNKAELIILAKRFFRVFPPRIVCNKFRNSL